MKTKGIVSKKEQKFRDDYQAYLKMLKKKGRAAFKRAKTQAEWRASTQRTRDVEKARARS